MDTDGPNDLLAPPPPAAVEDQETAAIVDQELAKRHANARWKPSFSPSKDDIMESPPTPPENSDRLVTRQGTVKLDALVALETASSSVHTGPSPSKVIYKYAQVYENQRGWTRVGTFKFSSRALGSFLHTHDPAPFTKFEEVNGRLQEINLPYNFVDEVQLPSTEWAWYGPEWLIDMAGDGMTSYDGFQYNNYFKGKGWKPVAPKWNSYFFTCCRRRRWLRLMVYLPSLVSSDASGNYHFPNHISTASEPNSPFPNQPSTPSLPTSPNTEQFEVWRGDKGDWERCHAALRKLGQDGRKLELWKLWIGELDESRSKKQRDIRWTDDQVFPDGVVNSPVSEFIEDQPFSVDSSRVPREHLLPVLQNHAQDILSSFVYPDSRARFHDLLQQSGLLEQIPFRPSLSSASDHWTRPHPLSS